MMQDTPILIVMTGATSGIGLAAARAIGGVDGAHLIVGARAPERAEALRGAVPAERLTVLPLDTASLASVRAFSAAVLERCGERKISALGLNAGMQGSSMLQSTDAGVERTFATNCLGHFALADLLGPALAPGSAVVITASQSHDPADRVARLLGYRGAIFPGASAVAKGELDPAAGPAQSARDRYATSKLCCLLWTFGMARRTGAEGLRYLAFDPGTVPATGIARELGVAAHLGWTLLMPLAVPFLPGFSTPAASGRALARLLTARGTLPPGGVYLDHRLKPAALWKEARRADWQDDLLAVSADIIARH